MKTKEFDVATAPLMSDEQVDALMDALQLSTWNAPPQADPAARPCGHLEAGRDELPPEAAPS